MCRSTLALLLLAAVSCGGDSSSSGGPNKPPAAIRLEFVSQPNGATAGTILAPAVEVAAEDQNGNLVADYDGVVTIVIGAGPSGALLSGTSSVAAAGGSATFPDLVLTKAAPAYTLSASASGLTSATSASFAITPGPAAALKFSVPPGSSGARVSIAPAVQVTAADQFGNLATGFSGAITMALAANAAGGVLAGTATATASAGTATFPGLSLDKAGTGYTLAATSPGLLDATSPGFAICANCWTPRAPLGIPTMLPGAGVVSGKLHVVGGMSGTTILGVNAVYDPRTDRWASRRDMPTERRNLGVGVVNGVIYAVGGFNTSGVQDKLEAYDPATDSWASEAPMPTARLGLDAAVVNGIVYAIGGSDGSGHSLATNEAYDPTANSWTTLAPMPTARTGLRLGVVNGLIYAVGGDTAIVHGETAIAEVYDPATNTWSTTAPMPTARSFVGIGVVNGLLYVIGGSPDIVGVVGTVEAYNPATNTWTTMTPMPTARWSHAVAVEDGVIYVAGGDVSGATNGIATVEAYSP